MLCPLAFNFLQEKSLQLFILISVEFTNKMNHLFPLFTLFVSNRSTVTSVLSSTSSTTKTQRKIQNYWVLLPNIHKYIATITLQHDVLSGLAFSLPWSKQLLDAYLILKLWKNVVSRCSENDFRFILFSQWVHVAPIVFLVIIPIVFTIHYLRKTTWNHHFAVTMHALMFDDDTNNKTFKLIKHIVHGNRFV